MASPALEQDIQVPLPEQEASIEEQIGETLSTYQGKVDELIPILQGVQQKFGYIPEQAIGQIARFLRLPEIDVFGVATFYAQFKLAPVGRNTVKVCRGTACHVRGAARILQEAEKQLGIRPGETTPDLEYSLETVACFGACALSPIMVLNDKVHGRMTKQEVRSILDTIGGSSELKEE